MNRLTFGDVIFFPPYQPVKGEAISLVEPKRIGFVFTTSDGPHFNWLKVKRVGFVQ